MTIDMSQLVPWFIFAGGLVAWWAAVRIREHLDARDALTRGDDRFAAAHRVDLSQLDEWDGRRDEAS